MQETIEKQSQKAFNDYPILYKGDDSKLIQYNPIEEVNQILSLLSEPDTSTTYQKAAEKTWLLLKKAIVLFLFIGCFIVALPIWVSGVGFQYGFRFRKWLDTEQPSIEQIVNRLLEFIAAPFKAAYAWASWFVKQYLNWGVQFDSVPQTPPAPSSESETK
ncbi:hypothetical protein IQ250_24680 [Pseudanabaenaceae cyanobacterium LEGE 13415]|nr:hypothetical protein [Pseudanabaenaceae cyanobacterium LEGE 13415]